MPTSPEAAAFRAFSLAGRTAVITGASRGIGQSLATALAAAGASVALIGRDADALNAVQQPLASTGCHATCHVADISVPARIDALFEEIDARHGRIDILVNNAGIEEVRPSLEVDEALWARILATNLGGAFFCAQAAAARMPQGGAILNLCSLTSERGVSGAAPYSASKAGLAGLTRTLATEWAPRGVRVNAIAPGYFQTALTEPFFQNPEWQQAMLEKIPLRRFGRLEDVQGAAVFLCSPAAGYITGQILYVDGGCLSAL